jgi:hypothetical protein
MQQEQEYDQIKMIENAQIVVNQTHIVATQTDAVTYIVHPDPDHRRIKGGFYLSKGFGQLIVECAIEQVGFLMCFYYF